MEPQQILLIRLSIEGNRLTIFPNPTCTLSRCEEDEPTTSVKTCQIHPDYV